MQTKIYGFPYVLLVINGLASGVCGGTVGALAIHFATPVPDPEPAVTLTLPALPAPSLPQWELVGDNRVELQGSLELPNQVAPRVWRILLDDGTVCYHDSFNSMACDYMNRREIP